MKHDPRTCNAFHSAAENLRDAQPIDGEVIDTTLEAIDKEAEIYVQSEMSRCTCGTFSRMYIAYFGIPNDGQPWYKSEWENAKSHEFAFYADSTATETALVSMAESLKIHNVPGAATSATLLAIGDDAGSNYFVSAAGQEQMAWAESEMEAQAEIIAERINGVI